MQATENTRILRLRASSLVALIGLTLLCIPPAALLAQTRRPSVLLITVDTLRADRVGAYGYDKARTPNMDALARDGVLFERAYTPVPVTLPSHSAMLTGLYPMRTGMRDFSGNRLPGQFPTLAEELKKAGYSTGAVVSAAVLDARFGLSRGFEFYLDDFDFSRLADSSLDSIERRADRTVELALQWLRTREDRPVFLWVHLFDPHHPYKPPAPYDSQFRNRPYDGEIAFTDAQIGRLLGQWKKSGRYDDSLIILAGDHGESLGEHGESTHGLFVYNSTLHVPLIIKTPASMELPAGRVDAPMSLVDLMPTVLRIAGRRPPAGVQGVSLLPLLRGERAAQSRRPIYAETFVPRLHFNWSELQSVQLRNFHYIDAPRPELYDISADPAETRNLFEQRGRIAADLRGRLASMIQRHSPPSGETAAEETVLDPALMEKLKSLGYAAVSGGGSATLDKRELPDPKDRIEVFELVAAALADAQANHRLNSNQKLTQALALEPDSVPVRFLLASNLYSMKRYLSAIKEFDILLKQEPNHSQALYYRGLAQGRTGDYKGAITTLQKAAKLVPNNHATYFNLGVAYLQDKQFNQAAQSFERAIELFPAYAQAQLALGELHFSQGRADEAIPRLQAALRLVPGNKRARQALAAALKSTGRDTEAAEVLRGPPTSR